MLRINQLSISLQPCRRASNLTKLTVRSIRKQYVLHGAYDPQKEVGHRRRRDIALRAIFAGHGRDSTGIRVSDGLGAHACPVARSYVLIVFSAPNGGHSAQCVSISGVFRYLRRRPWSPSGRSGHFWLLALLQSRGFWAVMTTACDGRVFSTRT